MVRRFGDLSPAEQKEHLRRLYERRDEGVGSNVRFKDDLGRLFLVEDVGGDINFHVFDLQGETSLFASLSPWEVVRLNRLLEERIRDYPARIKETP